MECFSVAFLRNLKDNYNDILGTIYLEKNIKIIILTVMKYIKYIKNYDYITKRNLYKGKNVSRFINCI